MLGALSRPGQGQRAEAPHIITASGFFLIPLAAVHMTLWGQGALSLSPLLPLQPSLHWATLGHQLRWPVHLSLFYLRSLSCPWHAE